MLVENKAINMNVQLFTKSYSTTAYFVADMSVSLCKFHRIQAWNRRLTKCQHKDAILAMYVRLLLVFFFHNHMFKICVSRFPCDSRIAAHCNTTTSLLISVFYLSKC